MGERSIKSNKKRFNWKTNIITGSSDGIGLETAKEQKES